MRIVYIARHGCGGADDEGAIAHALRVLGHRVYEVQEKDGHTALKLESDLILFHKWTDVATLEVLKDVAPRAFWYPDLVSYDDPSLRHRCDARMHWMRTILPHVELGFCTDGDWVNRVKGLYWLPQGADERVVGRGTAKLDIPILFTGGHNGGEGRRSFVDEMAKRYGTSFVHVQSGCYGRHLADLIAGARIVVAPDAPVTDRYWSNRAYSALGFGAFLLHPRCEGLEAHYDDGVDLVYYQDRSELHDLIETFLGVGDERQRISELGLERTKRQHLYRHRALELLRIVKERT